MTLDISGPDDAPPPTLRQAWRRFWPHLSGQYGRFFGAAMLLAISAAAKIVSVFVLADVVDGTLAAQGFSAFLRLALLWLGVTAASALADYAGQVLSVAASERVVLRLRDNVFRHVQTLSPAATKQFGAGDLVIRHTSDLDAVEHLLGSGLMQLAIAVLTTVGLVAVAMAMSWPMAVVALAAVPLLWGISAFFGRRQARVTQDERSAISAIARAVSSAIAGHESAAAYNQQHREHDRLHAHGIRWRTARLAQTRIEAGFGSILGCAEVVMTLAIAVTGVWQVRRGAITIGELIALTGYLGLLYPRMQEISELRLSVASAVVSAGRLMQVLDRPASDVDPVAAVVLSEGTGRVRIRDVTVNRGSRRVLDRVTVTLTPGTITALTGASGAGKSTLASLLAGFEHPDAGRIWIDGTDISRVSRKSLRDKVTLLPQSPHIAAMTVADAIAYGRPEASREEVVAAAKAACADTFIADLAEGYDTYLDDDMPLSGGQRQRLAIARALLRDSPVLVLDEPTTGLDPAAAHAVMSGLRQRTGSTLIITHDPQVAALADTVIRLVDGHLVRGVTLTRSVV